MDMRLAPGTQLGEGKPEMGWGKRDPMLQQLKDAFVTLVEGLIVQFRARKY